MKVFICGSSYEDMLTCIYDAWSCALGVGHSGVCLMREPLRQLDMFADYIHVDADYEKSDKVMRSVRRISDIVYMNMFYALMSWQDDALDAVYRYLIVAFKEGRKVEHMLILPEVMKVMELRRTVGNEVHRFREFARFTAIDRRVYVCHIEPRNNVLIPVAEHFADRMMSEHWMILDDNRRLAAVHPRDENMYIRVLTDNEAEALSKAEKMKDEYTDMWKSFFETIGIEQRENPKCQRNMFPIWSRKHVTEFVHDI